MLIEETSPGGHLPTRSSAPSHRLEPTEPRLSASAQRSAQRSARSSAALEGEALALLLSRASARGLGAMKRGRCRRRV